MKITRLKATRYVAVFIVLFLSFDAFAQGANSSSGRGALQGIEALAQSESLNDSVENTINISENSSDDLSYILGVDDAIKVVVFGEADLSNTYKIGSTGSISFPLIGEIVLSGKSIREAEDLIEAKLSDGYLIEPSVSIEISSYRTFYILGEVRSPGSYNYQNGVNVLKAVALAGGFTYRANKKNVQILKTRKDGSDLYDKMPVSTSITPGDIILVKERFF